MNPAIIFRDGWRAFFLAAGIFAVVAMLAWLSWLGSGREVDLLLSRAAPPQWHAHEMIFGYATAAVGGFFLTAVPSWTGTKAAPERFVATVVGLWLAGRVAVWFSADLPAVLVAVIDLAFLPVLAVKILIQLLARPKPQNLMLLGMITMLWLSNLLIHLDWIGWTGTEAHGQRAGILALCAMITALGGRLTPAFTRNALLRIDPEAQRLPVSRRPLDMAGLVLAILTAVGALLGLPTPFVAVLAIGAGVVTVLRLVGWETRQALNDPIVWSLHLGYAMLAIGFVAWGLAGFGIGTELGALHVLGIGAIGGMTLAVMSRATIGHSGRALRAPATVALAYALIPLATLLRWAAEEWPGAVYTLGTLGAGALWTAAFTLYIVALWPIWTRPRPVRQSA